LRPTGAGSASAAPAIAFHDERSIATPTASSEKADAVKVRSGRFVDQAATTPSQTAGVVGEGFPRIYAVIKWAVVLSLVFLAVLAAAFWVLILGRFAGSGYRAPQGLDPSAVEKVSITPECAWPYDVSDHDARAVCRMFYNLTPEERARVLQARK
jgi:hypothetical protein